MRGAAALREHPRTRHPRCSSGASDRNTFIYEPLEEHMAKTSQRVRQQRTPKYKTRGYTRCRRCGRARAVYRKFGVCRICLRELAHNGYVPGMTKSSW